MEQTELDAKTLARLRALTAWAASAAGAGLSVPAAPQLELIAVARSAESAGVGETFVLRWAATMNWLMGQAAFGVVDPHLQLPEELKMPAELRLAVAGPGDAMASGLVAAVPEATRPEATIPAVPAKSAPRVAGKATVPASKLPKWELAAMEQVRDAITHYAKPLQDLRARDANEGDTRLVVTDMLCEGLDYDKFRDLTTEYMVKQDFADYGVRIDKQMVAFIEVKRISQKLNERHLRQVQMYAVNEGVEWMVLTNGALWQAYHLTGGLPVIVNMAFEIDLLGPASLEEKSQAMFLLHREALKRRRIDEVWKHRAVTEPGPLLGLILSETILDQIRKEVKRQTGITTTVEDLSEAIKTGIVDPKLIAKLYRS
ncbi:type I restriction enzyme HsdR N-terminal domain-containing protein [Arthrobacter livingstonensis]|nr:type I restriction enzyme HsdR N-terminal domain-containing protein [Arthrobacter livingstonensis]